MKVEMGEKQSIAWFKLAEFIGRGEKERALSLFRLLTHSFSDRAFIKKLEAEILASFEDQQAVTEYINSAHLYRSEGKAIEAVSIYEMLIRLEPSRPELFEKVISLFQELGNKEKVLFYQKQLCTFFLTHGSLEKGIALFEAMEADIQQGEKLIFFQQIVLQAITYRYPAQTVIANYLRKSLEGLLRFAGETDLNKFLTTLQAHNMMWHKDALSYLKEF